ncbi:DNA-binding protein [Salmonella enterica subsp. enterica serovar Kokomlemle]
MNSREEIDVERLSAFYPYRNEQGHPILDESLGDYAKRTNQTVNAVRRQADRVAIPVVQNGVGKERRVNLYAMFLKTVRHAEKYVKMTE